ncbi:MAG: hypothetical protein U1F43_18445 [Myxococcota bacterium]
MRRYAMTSAVAALLAIGACSDDKTTTDTSTGDTTSTTDTTTDTSTTDTTGGNTSAVTGVTKPANPKAEPTPNAGCATSDNLSYEATAGFTYPWEGATVDGTTYTCDGCKTGDSKLQGQWRVHGFVNADGTGDMDYDFPDPATDYAETLFVDGNTWVSHIKDVKASSEGTVRGFYFCSQKPEMATQHLFWIVTASDDADKPVGYVFETDVVLSAGGDNLILDWYDEPGSVGNQDFQYCRLGTKNGDNAEQTCTNPFQ